MKKSLAFTLAGLLLFSACATPSTDTQMEVPTETLTPIAEDEVTETVTEDEVFNYAEDELETALQNGQTVFIDFFATWCPICRANEPKVDAIFEEINDEDYVFFRADYDEETALKKRFGVFQQSTYILIPNGEEDDYETLGPGVFTESQFREFMTDY